MPQPASSELGAFGFGYGALVEQRAKPPDDRAQHVEPHAREVTATAIQTPTASAKPTAMAVLALASTLRRA